MKLKRIRLTNFRCYETLDLDLGQSTVFVGTNNCGKSAVLSAVNKFWKSSNRNNFIVPDDFYVHPSGGRSHDLVIELLFDELDPQAIDDFSEYTAAPSVAFRLKARLSNGIVEQVKFHGVRQGLEGFRATFELSKISPIKEFNDSYTNLLKDHDLPDTKTASSKEKKLNALRVFEANFDGQLSDIESSDEAYGAVGPIPTIRKYFRFVYIPAVKNASDESSEANNAMSELVSYAARKKTNFEDKLSELEGKVKAEMLEMMDDQQEALKEIESKLNETLSLVLMGTERTELVWTEPDRTIRIPQPYATAKVRSDQFLGDVSSFGHGIQRTYLLSVLKLVSEIDSDEPETSINLMVGFEEPELYQHPPQVDMLCYYLRKLSHQHQTLITTHSPKFIIPDNFESVCRVQRIAGKSSIKRVKLNDLNLKMRSIFKESSDHLDSTLSSLGTLLTHSVPEVFFSTCCVLVEGYEDVGYMSGLVDLFGYRERFVTGGINIIPVHGKNELIPAFEVCKAFDIPTYVIADSDSNYKNEPKKWESVKKTNLALFKQLGIESDDGSLSEISLTESSCIWPVDFANSVGNDFPGFTEILHDYCQKVGAKKKQARSVQTALAQFASVNLSTDDKIKSGGKIKGMLEGVCAFAGV